VALEVKRRQAKAERHSSFDHCLDRVGNGRPPAEFDDFRKGAHRFWVYVDDGGHDKAH
jgi:hypothetical protein